MRSQDLRSLSERAAAIEGRQASRLTEVHGRIRTARRRRAAAASVGAAGLVLAVVLGASEMSLSGDPDQDPVTPPSTPTPSETIGLPDSQVTVRPDIGPDDIRGWSVIGSRVNTQPELLGATDLSMSVTVRSDLDGAAGGAVLSEFCRGSRDTWYSLRYGNGGRRFGRCSPDASMPTVPQRQEIGPSTPRRDPQDEPVRMFVARPTAEWVSCYTEGLVEDCDSVSPLRPLDSTTAEFGFVMHEHRAAPTVLELFAKPFEALLVTEEGEEYVLHEAVLAAADASTLVVRVGPSDRERLVALYQTETPRTDRCRRRFDSEGVLEDPELHPRSAFEEMNRRCVAQLQLRVDGEPAADEGLVGLFFGSSGAIPAAVVPAGAREVTVDVVENDPRNVRFAIVVWRARS